MPLNSVENGTVPMSTARRPASEAWLRNPAWIDGGVNPPQYYFTHEEMNETLVAYGLSPRPVPLQDIRDRLAALNHNTPPPFVTEAPSRDIPNSQPAVASAEESSQNDTTNLVTVVMVYTSPAAPITRSSKGSTSTKKNQINKAKSISIKGATRSEFIKDCLAVHDVGDRYEPGAHSGPDFKIWWAGSVGGKTGSPTITTDEHFKTIITELQAKDNTSRKATHVSVEFDVSKMEGFRVKPQVPWDEANGAATEDELAHGTHVPHIGAFSEASQLHGTFIVMLKQKWKCESHPGEHGEPGFCYVTPNHGHFPLNNKRFKCWASAIAAGNCTKSAPPNAPEFDGVHDGTAAIDPRPRGRNGPYPAGAGTASNASNSDVSTLLGVATMALLKDLTRQKRRRHYSSSPPSTPPRMDSSPVRAASPIIPADIELSACLKDLKSSKGIDLTEHEATLNQLEFTPAVIPMASVTRLCEVMHVPEGRALLLQSFCREWQANRKAKSRRNKKVRRYD